jgi:glycerol dehydrogenase
MVTSTSRAFGSPFRYIQGPGEFNNLETYASQYGERVFVLVDAFLYDKINADLEKMFAGKSTVYKAEKFGGECTEAEVARISQLAKTWGADVMVGVGGGKTLDTAKLVAAQDKLTQFIVPTSASTDAPTSSMSVVYKETGEHLYSVCHKRGSDLVLVDTKIIAGAPVRLFVAGIGDALSTYFEARANAASDTANYIGSGYRRTKASMAIAKMCYDVLIEDGYAAKMDLENGALTEAVENVIEANILLSGLGFENTGCAGAHSVHTGIHEIPGTNKYFHGEMVAFGVLFQLVMENVPKEELDKVVRFMKSVGLPITLRQLGVEPTPENIRIITGRIVDGNSGVEAEPFLITEDLVYNALISADAIGTRYLNMD